MLDVNPGQTAAAQDPTAWQTPVPPPVHPPARPQIQSSILLQGGRELLISHAGDEYHLRLTRNNKLILTK